MDDTTIRSVVTRLARPHASGGDVIERAAIMAEGADSAAILAWVVEHAGPPEALAARGSGGGLHGARMGNGGGADLRNPLRFVLPAGLCDAQPGGPADSPVD
jgi:hypothetical protein